MMYDYLISMGTTCNARHTTDKITFIYTVPSISIGTVKTKLLCWLWSQDNYKYDKKMNMRQKFQECHFLY